MRNPTATKMLKPSTQPQAMESANPVKTVITPKINRAWISLSWSCSLMDSFNEGSCGSGLTFCPKLKFCGLKQLIFLLFVSSFQVFTVCRDTRSAIGCSLANKFIHTTYIFFQNSETFRVLVCTFWHIVL